MGIGNDFWIFLAQGQTTINIVDTVRGRLLSRQLLCLHLHVYTVSLFNVFGSLPTSQELVAHNIQGRSSVVFDLPKLPCHHNLGFVPKLNT